MPLACLSNGRCERQISKGLTVRPQTRSFQGPVLSCILVGGLAPVLSGTWAISRKMDAGAELCNPTPYQGSCWELFAYYDDPISRSKRLCRYQKRRAPLPNVSPKSATRWNLHFADPDDATKEAELEARLKRGVPGAPPQIAATGSNRTPGRLLQKPLSKNADKDIGGHYA
jgi:hypothetical protein